MRSGKVEVSKAASRLCKAKLYKRWLELCGKMEMLYARPPAGGKLYSEVKVRVPAILPATCTCIAWTGLNFPSDIMMFLYDRRKNDAELKTLILPSSQGEAKAYQEAKELMKKSFKSIGGGNWVKKPMEQDQFEIDS